MSKKFDQHRKITMQECKNNNTDFDKELGKLSKLGSLRSTFEHIMDWSYNEEHCNRFKETMGVDIYGGNPQQLMEYGFLVQDEDGFLESFGFSIFGASDKDIDQYRYEKNIKKDDYKNHCEKFSSRYVDKFPFELDFNINAHFKGHMGVYVYDKNDNKIIEIPYEYGANSVYISLQSYRSAQLMTKGLIDLVNQLIKAQPKTFSHIEIIDHKKMEMIDRKMMKDIGHDDVNQGEQS